MPIALNAYEGSAAILIRQATAEDASVISNVLGESFAAYQPHYTTKAFQATVPPPHLVLERMREGPVWLALLGDVPAGTASAVVTAEGCYIRGMAVIPAARGHRIGWKLLDEIDGFARVQGLPRLYLSTTPFLHRAIALYEQYGFRRTDDGPSELFGTPLFTMMKSLLPDDPEARLASPDESA